MESPLPIHFAYIRTMNRPLALAVLECGGKSARHRFRASLDFQAAIDVRSDTKFDVRRSGGARLCAGQRGASRSSRERCDALRLVFDTAALRRRFKESPLSICFRMHWDHEPSIPRLPSWSAVASPRDTAFARRWTFKWHLTLRSGTTSESGVTATAIQGGKRVLTNLLGSAAAPARKQFRISGVRIGPGKLRALNP